MKSTFQPKKYYKKFVEGKKSLRINEMADESIPKAGYSRPIYYKLFVIDIGDFFVSHLERLVPYGNFGTIRYIVLSF